MFKVQSHCSSALRLLAVLCISTAVSVAQKPSSHTESSRNLVQAPIDAFAILPASDAVIVLDLKRSYGEMFPQILVDEPDLRALVMAASPDTKTAQLLDPRAVQRVVAGIRYNKPPDEKTPSDFSVITIAQSNEAGQLPALIRSKGSGKYREEQYGGKLLYITQLEQTQPPLEWAIVALDANPLAFGHPAYVRSSIDVLAGKDKKVNADLMTAVKRSPKALLSAAGLLPPSFMSAPSQLSKSDWSQMLSSVKQIYLSVDLIPTGLAIAGTLTTTSPEQTKSLVDFISAIKTIVLGLGPNKTREDKVARDLFKGLVISAGGSEVQVKDEISQASINELVKQYAAQMYFSKGLAQVQKGESEAAIAEFTKVIKLDSESANAFVNRGKAHANMGALDEAIADYDKAIALEPDNEMAYNNRCFTQVGRRNFDAAIADCDKTIAIRPNFAYAYNNRGQAFASQGKIDKAFADYDKSIAFDGENIFAYENRGNLRIEVRNWDGAIADFEKSITINAKSAVAYNGRGLARYYKGELDQALADFDKALSLEPNLAITYNNRALALAGKGNVDQALADYEKSIALNDKDGLVYTNRGYLRQQKGDSSGALADFDKAVVLNPKSADAYNGRGLSRLTNEESDQAIADFDKAIAISPLPYMYVNRGLARNQKSDYDGALVDFDKAISLDPNLAEAYNGRGVAHSYKAHLDQAIADFDKAIAIDPNLAEAYGNRALSLLELRKDAQAEQDLKKCFELNESLRSIFDPAVKEVKKLRRTKHN